MGMIDPLQKLKQQFSYLSDEDMMEMMNLSYTKVLSPGEVLIKSGEKNWEISMVLEGLLRSFLETEEGEYKTVLFRKEGDVIGAHRTLIRNLPTTETVEALEPTTLFCVDYRKLQKLIETKPTFARLYINYIENLFMDAVDRVDDFTLRNPEQRYRKFKKENEEILRRAPQKYIASYLGITEISLSRIKNRVKNSPD